MAGRLHEGTRHMSVKDLNFVSWCPRTGSQGKHHPFQSVRSRTALAYDQVPLWKTARCHPACPGISSLQLDRFSSPENM